MRTKQDHNKHDIEELLQPDVLGHCKEKKSILTDDYGSTTNLYHNYNTLV